MRRTLPLALAAAAALVAGGCSTSPCQRLGEKFCACTGLIADQCTTQVQDELKGLDQSLDAEIECQKIFDACNPPPDAIFCEWLNTSDGQVACGLTPEVVTTTTP